MNRRTVIQATGVTLTGTLLAGCSSGGQNQDENDNSNIENTPTEGGGGSSEAKNFDGWMEDVGNYNGIVDKTGNDDVVVKVGAEGNGGAYAFAPAAIKIASGTNIVWEWTGQGSPHNVVDDAGNFESEMQSEQGATFEHSFQSSGTFKYYCTPHKAMGMKGVVVVD